MRQYTVHLHDSEQKYLFKKNMKPPSQTKMLSKIQFFPLLRHCCGGFIPRFVVPFALILSAHAHRSSPIKFFYAVP